MTDVNGCLAKSVQKCPSDWGLILLIVNCFLPGIGTMVSSYCADSINWEAMGVGLCQLLTVPLFLIGWIWSIVWGVKIYEKSK